MLYINKENYYIVVSLEFVSCLICVCANMAKNPLRTFLGLNHDKNKNMKAWPKKGILMKKGVL